MSTITTLDFAAGYGAPLIVALISFGLCFCCVRIEAARAKAETACEELRKALMQGAAVGRWHRSDVVPMADFWYYHVQTTEGPLLLTDEQWQVSRRRAEKLLKPQPPTL